MLRTTAGLLQATTALTRRTLLRAGVAMRATALPLSRATTATSGDSRRAVHHATAATAAASTSGANHTRSLNALTEAVEIIDARSSVQQPGDAATTRLMLTCEHASLRMPEPWAFTEADSHLVGDHWSYDPGAEDFTRELGDRVRSVAVLSRYSRLLCDPNRPPESDTIFRTEADHRPVALNQPTSLTDADRKLRMDRLYHPYHAALKTVFDQVQPTMILSPHSFTPVYEGVRRTIEIGVLYNSERDRSLAEKFCAAYSAVGVVTALNAPWSAKAGFMYAADQFASPTTQVIMFEFRQDLVVDPVWRANIVRITQQVLREEGHL